jgi:hypothetical protein
MDLFRPVTGQLYLINVLCNCVIYRLFHDAYSISDYTAWNVKVISEQLIWNNMNEIFGDEVWSTVLVYEWSIVKITALSW